MDALTALLPEDQSGTLVIVQNQRPDAFFIAEHQNRMQELMARWRKARDTGQSLSPDEQSELDALVDAELRASTARAAFLLQELRQ